MSGEATVYRLTITLVLLWGCLLAAASGTHPYTSTASDGQELFIVDALDDLDTLLEHIPVQAAVYQLEPENTLSHLNAYLQRLPENSVNTLHVLSHGRSGQLQLGDSWLDASQVFHVDSWRHALVSGADVRLYACDVAQDADFVKVLAERLGASVSASNDVTGVGGNWLLETRYTPAEITLMQASAFAVSEYAVPEYKARLQSGDVVVIPVSPAELEVSEDGDTATFSVSLSGPQRPTSNVTVGFSFDPEFADEAEITPGEVVFTPTDFDNSRSYTIIVRGLDDNRADGDVGPFVVNIGTASEDDAYNRISKTEPSVINRDNDTAGLILNAPTGGLEISEAGDTDSFTVRLSAQPAPEVDVTVTLTVRDVNPTAGDPAATEASLNPQTLTFTDADWNIPKTVLVASNDDEIIDGNQNFFVDFTTSSSQAEGPFAGLEIPSLAGVNIDDDAAFAGITVDPLTGLTTSEVAAGEAPSTVTFTVVLNRGPNVPVSVPVQSNDSSEGVVAPPTLLVFTPANWNVPQTVTVRSVDDEENDGDQTYTISVGPSSSDQGVYDGIDPEDVEVINQDNDSPGFIVDVPEVPTVTEPSGTLTVRVRLATPPAADVALPLSVSDETRATVSPAALTFTPDNWNVFQMVMVSAIDNDIDDDRITPDTSVTFDIVTGLSSSNDSDYSSLDPVDVTVTYDNDDEAAINVSPRSGLVTTEASGEASFNVSLVTRPTTAVTVTLVSSDQSEGAVVPPNTLTFTPDDWNEPQQVNVRGLDDNLDDGDQAYNVTVEGSGEYSGVNASVALRNLDNDTAAVIVSPTDGLITSETGSSDAFNVVLATTPEASVTIDFGSSETSEGTVEPNSVTFDGSNWNVPQMVTVTGVDDTIADGNVNYQIEGVVNQTSDAAYLGASVAAVAVVNIDDDTPGVTVTPVRLTTLEGGVLLENGCQADAPADGADGDTGDEVVLEPEPLAQACFRIVLNSRPQSSVSITLTSDDESEGTVSPPQLAFTPVNWDIPQFVTVTAVDDGIVDADTTYTIVTSPVQSDDSDYDGLVVPDVSVTNLDNNASISVTPLELTISEAPGDTMQATFNVNLDAPAPAGAEVVIGVRSSNPNQGTVSPSVLRFLPSDETRPKTVTVTAVNDNIAEGDVSFMVMLDPAVSPGNGYDGIDAADVTVTALDDDEAGVSIRALNTPITVSEDGDSSELRVVLDSQPTADVSVPVSVSDSGEGSLSADTLIFTADNWNTEQALIVRGVDDRIVDGDTTFTVTFGAVTSDDPAYGGLTPSPATFTVTNEDNDRAAINITLLDEPLETDENGGSSQFSVVLASQPTDSVSIDLRSSDPSEGTPVPAVLTFTADSWNIPQTVTVSGLPDGTEDGDVRYEIAFAPARSSDSAYSGLTPDPLSVLNRDRDGSRILIINDGERATSEGGSSTTFEVLLATEPSSNVTFDLVSSNPDEATVTPSSITFTPSNFDQPQLVIVTGVDDSELDGDVSYDVVLDNVRSGDPNYSSLEPTRLAFVNRDNEAAQAPNIVAVASVIPPDVVVPEGDSVRSAPIHQFGLAVPNNVRETVALTRVGVRVAADNGGDFFEVAESVALYLDRDNSGAFNLPDAPPIATRTSFTNPETGLLIFELNPADPLIINDENGNSKNFIVTFSMPAPEASLPTGVSLLTLALIVPFVFKRRRTRLLMMVLVALSLSACGGDADGPGSGPGTPPIGADGEYQVILTRVDATANDQGVPNNLPDTGIEGSRIIFE